MFTRRELANAIRALSMDAVQKANSGHPGMPMGMADIAEVLWNDYLNHDPKQPSWPNRDRFVLSNGHGSMLQYSLLHLTGYDVSIEDLKNFRQLNSKTPGHPEYGHTPGVETTTGPLGQGLAAAVGMAIAEKVLASQFNQEGHDIVDHYTYVCAGDGCMMEGISHEACSLAGVLGLGKLIVFYDDNDISIDGDVNGWFQDDTSKRFEAYQWHVVKADGHDSESIIKAINEARAVTDKPSLICCKTVIGYGAPNAAGSEGCHGAPLGEEEITAARAALKWTYPAFQIPDDIYNAWDACKKGAEKSIAWQAKFEKYQQAFPELAAEFLRRIKGQLPDGWANLAEDFIHETEQEQSDTATRKASLACLNQFGPVLPEMLGGSADLTGSNLTLWKGSVVISKEHSEGNYIHYGVREFAMTAICNGIALYGGFIPYCGTFLVFSDYARNAVRLAAMMQQRVVLVYTHDSIGLGEDGPTHQPVEHAAMLRLTPNMSVWRPCDATETAVAWRAALERINGPTSLLLSRQTLVHQARSKDVLKQVARGGYILSDGMATPDAILIATGSEVELAMAASKVLQDKGYQIRVVSMPSTDVFDSQDKQYRKAVLPDKVKARVAIEAASKDYWYKYVGFEGAVIGLSRFGHSAPFKDAYKALGFTVENVVETVMNLVNNNAKTACLAGGD